MPVQKGKSVLAGVKGLDTAVKGHAADAYDPGNQPLPPGIRDGVAKLVECKFDLVAAGKQNAGKPYFRAAGVVVEPESVTGADGREIPVKGRQTSVMCMVCDTKTQAGKVTSLDDNVATIMNEMKGLGYEFAEGDVSGADLEAAAAALKEAGPYFRFSTSQGKVSAQFPNPRVWENWSGAIPDYSPSENGDAVEDATGGEAPAEEPAAEEPAQVEEPAAPEEPQVDLDALVAKASEKKVTKPVTEAQAQLRQLAIDAGNDAAAVDALDTWQQVRELIEGGGGTQEETVEEAVEEEAAQPDPEVGNVYKYQRVGKDGKPLLDTKKKPIPPTDVEVTAVDAKARKANLVSSDKKLKFSGVSWDALIIG